MENKKVVVEFVQATYDLESLLLKVESLCKKINHLHSSINFSTLTEDELAVIENRALKVLQVVSRMEEVNS